MNIIDAYVNGFQGAPIDKEHRESLVSSLPMGIYGNYQHAIKGSGKGKIALPFKYVQFHDSEFGYYEPQTTGDCFLGNLLVNMADGSKKEIKNINIGDFVISASGNKQVVTRIIKKQYSGKILSLKCKNHINTISSTPDHKYIIDPISMEGKPISELVVGDKIFIPSIKYEEDFVFDLKDFYSGESVTDDIDFKSLRLEPVSSGKIRAKNGRHEINRFIKLDDKLCWLIGLYAAEGGVDGTNGGIQRITFNLGSHESVSALQVKNYIQEIFGFSCRVYQVPSKPTVIYVRVNNVIIAEFFKKMCYGNTYTKGFSKELFITSKLNKTALLKGWFDGDGYLPGRIASSVSQQLIKDFSDISNDLGLNFSVYPIKRKGKIDSYNIRVNGTSGDNFCIEKTKYQEQEYIDSQYRMVEIKEISESDYSGYVYCIEVDNDHTFIGNSFGVFNCTSHGARNACYVTKCSNIHQRKSPEIYKGRLATEVIYGYRGFSGQGMSPSRAAQFVSKVSGVHLRQKYGKYDLSKYNSDLGSSWGRSGPPKDLIEAGKVSPVKTVSLVHSIDDVLDLVYNGYGLTIASNFGFTNKRDKNGICKRSGNWNHQMSIVGADDSGQRDKDPLFLIQNSWGPNWVGGPRVLDQPEGSFWVYAETLLGMIRDGECWSFSDFEGFPSKDLDWSEFNEIY